MNVKYKIFDKDKYLSCCTVVKDSYPDDIPPTVEEYTKTGTGKVIEFIKGGFWSKDKFLIADDKSGKFIKVEVCDCTVINENV